MTHNGPSFKKKIISSIRWALGFVFAIVLLACGGSGTTLVPAGKPKVQISWPQITREINAPAYCNSATIELLPYDNSATVSWSVDRPSGSSPQTITYESPSSVTTPCIVTVKFNSALGFTGNIVANASVSFLLASDGSMRNMSGGHLGSITYNTEISGLNIEVNDMPVGSQQAVAVTGTSVYGIVALTQAKVNVSISSGQQYASLSNGLILANSVGPSVVQASFEGFNASKSFNVVPASTIFIRYAFPANSIAYDATRNRIWGTFGDGSVYGNSIVDIDLSNGTVGAPITILRNPRAIAVSKDGTYVYSGPNSYSPVLERIDVATRQLISSLQLRGTATSIDVNSTNSSLVTVCAEDPTGGQYGPAVYNGDSLVGGQLGIGGGTSNQWISNTRLVKRDFLGDLVLYDISGNSVQSVAQHMTNVVIPGQLHVSQGSKVLLEDGSIYSTMDLSPLGTLALGNSVVSSMATDQTSDFAWITVKDSAPLRIQVYNLSTFQPIGEVSIPIGSETITEMKRIGTKGLAILTNKAVYIVPSAPGL